MKLSLFTLFIVLFFGNPNAYAQSIESIEVDLNDRIAKVETPFFGIQHQRNTYNDSNALVKLKKLELTYVRFFADPEQFNPTENEWNWGLLDQTISELKAAGYEPIPAIFQAEDWDIGTPSNPWWNDKSNWPRWHKAVDSLVSRYADQVQWWILFDEINYLRSDRDYYMSFQTSADLYIETAERIHKIDRDAIIGGPTGFSGWENGHWAANYLLNNPKGAELLDFISSNIFLSWNAEEATETVLNKTIWYEEAPLEIKNRIQDKDNPLLMLDAFNFSALWTLNGENWTDPRNTSHIGGITQTLAYLHAVKGGFDLAFRWETLGGFGILRWFPAFEELPTYYNYLFLNKVIGLKKGAQLVSISTSESPIPNLPHHSTQNVDGYQVQPFAIQNEAADTLSIVLINKTADTHRRAIMDVSNQYEYEAAYLYSEDRAMQNSLLPISNTVDLNDIVIGPYSVFVAKFIKPRVTSIDEIEDNSEFPSAIQITNYPNPFNPTTSIIVELDKARAMQLTVYDLMGQKIHTLANDQFSAGRHQFTFNAANLPSGIYLYRLRTNEAVFTKKMTLLK